MEDWQISHFLASAIWHPFYSDIESAESASPGSPGLERKHVTIRENQRNAAGEEAFVEVIPGAMGGSRSQGCTVTHSKKKLKGRNRIDTKDLFFCGIS